MSINHRDNSSKMLQHRLYLIAVCILLFANKPHAQHKDIEKIRWRQTFNQNIVFSSDLSSSLKLLNDLEKQIQKEIVAIEKRKKQDDSLSPKGPFETTEAYKNRISLAEKKYADLFGETTSHLYKKRLELFDAFYPYSKSGVIPIFKLEHYDADQSNWRLIMKEDTVQSEVDISIEPEEAKKLWEHKDQLEITTWFKLKDSSVIYTKINYGSQEEILLCAYNESTTPYENSTAHFVPIESQATYDGDWGNFLRNNLDPNLPSDNNAPSGTYTVIVRFIVSKDGEVSNIVAESDPGYGMAQEAIRIIKKSGRWRPGSQNGRKVTSVKRQPITWIVEEQ